MLVNRWQEVEELKRPREHERLRALSPAESIRQFVELIELADKLPKWGDLKKLRRYETEQLVRWRKKMDTLGSAEHRLQ